MSSASSTENKRNIKNQRVKSLFLQAAKEIIINEGVGHVTVRKIADMTGYSYATIYHYFSDLDELLLEVKTVMIQDLVDYVRLHSPDVVDSLEGLKKQNHLFIDYFIDRPNIFTFFYSYRLGLQKTEFTVKADLGENFTDTFQIFVSRGIIQPADVLVIAKTIIYSIYGTLALYFSNNGLTKDKLHEDIDQIIDHLLSKREVN